METKCIIRFVMVHCMVKLLVFNIFILSNTAVILLSPKTFCKLVPWLSKIITVILFIVVFIVFITDISLFHDSCVCSLSELKESSSCFISISSEEPVYSGRNPIIPSSDRATRLSVDWAEVEGPAAEALNSKEFTRPFSRGLERIFSMALKYGQSGVSPLSPAVDLSRLLDQK